MEIEYTGYLAHRDGFLEAFDQSLYTPEWIDGQVWAGIYRVVADDQAAVMFTIRGYPTGVRELRLLASTGDLEVQTETLRPILEQIGRDMGCGIISLSSRHGWVKVMKQYGYTLYKTTLRKGL